MELKFEKHGQGKPLFLLHAFPLDVKMWTENLNFLIQNGFQIYLPHLQFDAENENALAETALKVAEIFDAENIKKAVVGGLSMGGYVCLNLFRMRRDLFSGLILCDTNSSADSVEKRNSRYELIEKLEINGNRELAESMLPKMVSENTKLRKTKVYQKISDWMLTTDVAANIAALKAMAYRKDHDFILNEIKIPTKIIFGAEDKITDLSIAEKLHKNISGSELSIIPDAGHLSSIEQPDIFNQEILEFLSKID